MKRISTLSIILSLSSAFIAEAQNLKSDYFMESSLYRHNLNPALSSDRGYMGIPLINNIGIQTTSNVGLSDFIYKFDDPTGKYDLTTFMSKSVDADEFLGNLEDNNRINLNIDYSLLSFGFRKFGGFNTFGIGIHSAVKANIPYEMFEFMKKAQKESAGTTYDLKDIALETYNYMDISFGHSRKINEKLTVGAKLKLLLGLGYAGAKFDEMNLKMSDNEWIVTADGYVDAALGDSRFKTKADAGKGNEVDGLDFNAGLAGYGAAIDLGATYQIHRDWLLSASVTDLGLIVWNKNQHARTNNQPYVFNGFEEIKITEESQSEDLNDQFNDVTDDLEDLFRVYDQGNKSKTTSLAANLYLAAEYTLPIYRKLRFGVLSTTQFYSPYTWSEARVSANIAPLKWIEANVNYAYSTFGSSLGWCLNLHPGCFNFFLATDYQLTKITPQGVPVNNANLGVNFGFSVRMGAKENKDKN